MSKLFISAVKMQFRDRLGLFWAFLFPAMFIVIFGLFNFDRPGSASLAIIDKAQTDGSKQFIEAFKTVDYFKISDQYTTEEAARQAIKDGKISFMVVIPESIKHLSSLNGQPPAVELTVVDDAKNKIENQVVLGVFQQFIDHANLSLVNAPRIFSLKEEHLEARKVSYMDFLLPGILGMALMTMAIIGIAVDLGRYREQRILKRILATPLRPGLFVVSLVFSYLVLVLAQVTVLLAIGHFFFGATIYGSLVSVYLLSMLGTLMFLNIGFIVASFSKSPNHASSLGNLISMPMMFLSGVFFPADSLPSAVHAVVQFLPLTPLMKAMRAVSLSDASLLSLGPDLGLIVAWLAITGIIAVRTFKFRQD